MCYIKSLVSVVIPTHNRKELIGRAVLSAQKQSYSNIEIIVVSDGSSDGTADVMNTICYNDDRVKFIEYYPGLGGNHARNEGIKAAKGEWVAFLDDDDEWHMDKIQLQIEKAAEDGTVGLICTAINAVDDASGAVSVFVPQAPKNSSREILLNNCIGSTTTVMVRHELLDQVGMFDEKLKARQDYDLWIRLCQITKVAVVEKPCVEYHNLISNGQISWNYEKYASAMLYMEEKYKKIMQEKLTPAEIISVRVGEQLSLSRKAVKAGNGNQARIYAKNALSIKPNFRAIIYYIASYMPLSFIKKVRNKVGRY